MLRQTVLAKAEEVKETKARIQQCSVLGVASLQKVRAAQLQGLRRRLEENAHLQVIKNSVVKRAIAECKDRPGLEKLVEHLGGANIFLFTSLNPFKLVLLLEKSRMKAKAKAGDIAAFDVTVPAGNTGMPPGPVISQLGRVGLPTRIESGSVWVTHDTLVAKKGDVIPLNLANVLSKLGMKPVEIGLTLKAVYDDGLIIAEDQLRVDLGAFLRSLKEAHTCAFSLSLNAAYPLAENITSLLQMAHHKAYSLALNADLITPDTASDLLRKAHAEMLSLKARLDAAGEKAALTSSVQKG